MYKPTEEQKAKAQERREEIRALTQQIKQFCQVSEIAQGLFIETIEGHELSDLNKVLLSAQNNQVSKVGGFRQWIKAGRKVKKGEKSLGIWIPAKDKKEKAATAEADAEASEIFFLIGNVFDISQTQEIIK
jgi:hypothetical protein